MDKSVYGFSVSGERDTRKMKICDTPVAEQETIIQISRDESVAHIWTNDRTVMTKLDKIYKVVQEDICEGAIYAKRYECPKSFISFRSKKVERKYNPQTAIFGRKSSTGTEIQEMN